MIIPRIIIDEEILCIMKYLIDDSVDNTLSFSISGINDISEISSPAQIITQLFEQIDTITPIIIVFMNISFVEFILIKKKKTLLLCLGYEPNSLDLAYLFVLKCKMHMKF